MGAWFVALALGAGVSVIANNYADVIEGGRPYAAGNYYPGVPAYGAEDDDEVLTGIGTFTCAAASSTSAIKTTINYDTTYPRLAGSINSSGTDYDKVYPHFLVGMSALNQNIVRRLQSWSGTTATVYTGQTFPESVVAAVDTFKPLIGFRRAPDNLDLMDLGATNAHDRFFSLEIMPGARDSWWGNNVEHYRTQMVLSVRFLKKNRARRVGLHALQNMLSLRSAICKPGSRDADNIVQLVHVEDTQPEPANESSDLLVMTDRFTVVYRIDSTHR